MTINELLILLVMAIIRVGIGIVSYYGIMNILHIDVVENLVYIFLAGYIAGRISGLFT